MPFNHLFLKGFIFVGIFLFGSAISDRALSYDFSDWEHGVSGHRNALASAKEEERPLIVYCHTEWCKWSKRMNREYLASYEVSEYLSDIPKVEINPEKGAPEKELCKKTYRVTGYPSFLVYIPAYKSRPFRIYPYRKGGNWTVEEFIKAIGEKVAHEYNLKGHSCYRNRKYEDAIEYHEMALDYDPSNAYAYYGMGMACYSMGYHSRNLDLVDKAEEHFINALDLNPDDEASKKQLEKIREGNEKMGRE